MTTSLLVRQTKPCIISPSILYQHSILYSAKYGPQIGKSKLMIIHQHQHQHQIKRPYIFFEPANRIKQAMQNIKALILNDVDDDDHDHDTNNQNMRKGEKIMIRLKKSSKDQMKAMTKLMKKNKTKLVNDWYAMKLLKTSSTRIRFRQFKQRIKQSPLSLRIGSYYDRKKTSITQHYHKRHNSKSMRHYLRSNLQKISSMKDLEKYKNKLKLVKDWIRYSNHAVTLNEPFRREWFTEHGYPLTSRDPESDRFVNPWQSQSTNGWKRLVDVWKWKRTRLFGYDMKHSLKKKLRNRHDSAKTAYTDIMNQVPCSISEQLDPPSSDDRIKMTWVGHATMLVQQSGFTILTDPVFSVKASPVQSFEEMEFLGVPRFSPPSFTIDDIPSSGVDICLISHDHYDHLDYDSVSQLNDKQLVKYWVVPLGIKDWLICEAGVSSSQIIELEWWQSVSFHNNGNDYFSPGNQIQQIGTVSNVLDDRNASVDDSTAAMKNGIDGKEVKTDFGDEKYSGNTMKITCAPAQHWCARSAIDRNTRLWCSWAIHSTNSSLHHDRNHSDSSKRDLSFYFAGDTAFPISFPLHRLIGEALGPFDLAALPIGAYAPRFFMRDSHCNPFESVRIHKDIRSKKSVAIHHSTFPLANEPRDEPMYLLNEAVNEEERHGHMIDFVGIPHGNFIESS